MKCPKCSNEISPESSFCGNCGSKIEKSREAEPEKTIQPPEVKETPQKAAVSESASPPPPPPMPTAAEQGYVMTDKASQPLGIGKYLLVMFVFSIPLVNVIMMIVWSISSKNINLRNFAIAAFIWIVIIIVVIIGFSTAIGVIFSQYIDQFIEQLF